MRRALSSRKPPRTARVRSYGWAALLRLAMAALAVLSLAVPAFARPLAQSRHDGPALSAALDAKQPIARLEARHLGAPRAAPSTRPAPLPSTRFCDAPELVLARLARPRLVLLNPGESGDFPHQLRRIPRMSDGEPPRA